MPRDNMLAELSKLLPEAVDQVTPDGRVPTQGAQPLGLAAGGGGRPNSLAMLPARGACM